MPSVRISTGVLLSTAVAVFILGAVWLPAVPDTLRVSTYVSVAVLLAGLTAVTLKTYAAGQATGSMGTLLYETNKAPATKTPDPRPRRDDGLTGRTR
jgi:hypothetical protein